MTDSVTVKIFLEMRLCDIILTLDQNNLLKENRVIPFSLFLHNQTPLRDMLLLLGM